MKNITFAFVSLFIFAIGGCKNSTTINQSEAGEVITDYLTANPAYKTTRFNFGEIKFNSRSEMVELEKYRQLENEGYVTLSLQTAKKKDNCL